MDEAEWLRLAMDKDVVIRRSAAQSDVERSLEIWKIQVVDEDVDVRWNATASMAKRPLEIWKIQVIDKEKYVRRNTAWSRAERPFEIWESQATDKDEYVRSYAAASPAERPIAIWRIQIRDEDYDVRLNAAKSMAKRPLEISKIQLADKDVEVREAILERKGVKIVLFRGLGEKEWSYFTKTSQGKVTFLTGLRTVKGIETKEGVLVIGDDGRVTAIGKPGKITKLPDIRASYPGEVREGKTKRVGTLLTRDGRFNLMKDDKRVLCWARERSAILGIPEVLYEAEELIKRGVSRELEI